jgi:hypothetical protein
MSEENRKISNDLAEKFGYPNGLQLFVEQALDEAEKRAFERFYRNPNYACQLVKEAAERREAELRAEIEARNTFIGELQRLASEDVAENAKLRGLVERLREELQKADRKLVQHHEIGFIQKAAEQWGGVCRICSVNEFVIREGVLAESADALGGGK